MAINVTLGEVKTQEEKPFPKMMISDKSYSPNKGMVVLFSERGKGVVVVEGPTFRIGHYFNDWQMNYFTDYNEPITIQNA